MYKVKVTSKGQITIPKQLREEMGINPGDHLEVKETQVGYVIKKEVNKEKLKKYVGVLNKNTNTNEIIEELRGNDSSD